MATRWSWPAFRTSSRVGMCLLPLLICRLQILTQDLLFASSSEKQITYFPLSVKSPVQGLRATLHALKRRWLLASSECARVTTNRSSGSDPAEARSNSALFHSKSGEESGLQA